MIASFVLALVLAAPVSPSPGIPFPPGGEIDPVLTLVFTDRAGAETRNALGEALLASGRPEEARAEFETALRLAPGDTRALANLARMPSVVP